MKMVNLDYTVQLSTVAVYRNFVKNSDCKSAFLVHKSMSSNVQVGKLLDSMYSNNMLLLDFVAHIITPNKYKIIYYQTILDLKLSDST